MIGAFVGDLAVGFDRVEMLVAFWGVRRVGLGVPGR